MSVSYQQLAKRNSQASGFSSEERAALRKYILDYNGMLFSSITVVMGVTRNRFPIS